MSIIRPLWSKKAVRDSCWYCEHFQRYNIWSNDQYVLLCEGECRKYPPHTQRNLLEQDTGLLLDDTDRYPFWFTKGQIHWCSGFQRSLEENIPDPPDLPSCSALPVVDAIIPYRYHFPANDPMPWSKRPARQSCWYCEHWQRLHETQSPSNSLQCAGWCRIQPQDGFRHHSLQAGGQEDVTNFVWITWGASMWCSRWERSTTPVEDPPDWGDGTCITQGGPG